MSNHNESGIEWEVSRRGFLKKALLGGAALSLSSRLALADQLATGRLTADDIHGVGMKPGRVEMSLNENPIGPSNRALRAISDGMFDINRYLSAFDGDGLTPLIEALAVYDGVKLPEKSGGNPFAGMTGPPASTDDVPVSPDEMMARMFAVMKDGSRTPYFIAFGGSGQILNLLALAYLNRDGSELIEADMGYKDVSRTAYKYKTAGVDTNVIRVPMTSDHRHDLNAMLSAITPRTSLIVITNPNNPTGTLLSYAELERFVNAVPSNIIILIDEAYVHFTEDPTYRRAIPLALTNDNVIVTRTFSKVYGMPGMRLGYAVSRGTIQKQLEFYEPMINFFPRLTLAAGIEAAKDLDHVKRSQQVVKDFRDTCYAELDKSGIQYIPSHTNFFMIETGHNADEVSAELFKRRVKVAARTQEKMPTWIRVSAGTESETRVFLNEFKDVLSKM
jgi:histidinol-phosphate aminotransferase